MQHVKNKQQRMTIKHQQKRPCVCQEQFVILPLASTSGLSRTAWWLYCHLTFCLQLITFEKLKIDRQKKQIRHTIFSWKSEILSFGRYSWSGWTTCQPWAMEHAISCLQVQLVLNVAINIAVSSLHGIDCASKVKHSRQPCLCRVKVMCFPFCQLWSKVFASCW